MCFHVNQLRKFPHRAYPQPVHRHRRPGDAEERPQHGGHVHAELRDQQQATGYHPGLRLPGSRKMLPGIKGNIELEQTDTEAVSVQVGTLLPDSNEMLYGHYCQ